MSEETPRNLLDKIKVVSGKEAEESSYYVCMPLGPSPFDDNLVGECSKCGCEVMYRPHGPTKPPKICIYCVPTNEKMKIAATSAVITETRDEIKKFQEIETLRIAREKEQEKEEIDTSDIEEISEEWFNRAKLRTNSKNGRPK